jgi:nodulation protein E
VKKVVVTGMGCVSGLGADKASTWQALIAGASGIRPILKFAEGQDELSFEGVGALAPADAAASLRDHYDEKQLSGVDPFSTFAAIATLEALKDAGLWGDKPRLAQAAIVYGSASGGNMAIEAGYRRIFHARLPNVHPMTIPRFMNSAAVSHLSMLFGVRGHSLAISSACASSAHALGEAMHLIRSGRTSIAIAGGSDASLTFGSLHGWKALQAMAPDACRPFSMDRKGLVLGEGAASLILEDEQHALKRGAPIFAELAGSGSTADARHITQPDAESAAAAIGAAHQDANLTDDAPLLISAHGTGTRLNDRTETAALHMAYPKGLERHRVIATKSAHGHMLGASGAMEFLIAILALNAGVAPPILGYLGPDPECDLPLVLKPEPIACEAAVSASFAFGGLNCVLVAKKHGLQRRRTGSELL